MSGGARLARSGVLTVETGYLPKSYKPGSAMSPEPIGFQFADGRDLIVTHIAAATGVRTVVAFGTAYQISGDGMAVPPSGTITALTAWPADDLFLIERATSRRQRAAFPAFEPLKSRDVQSVVDRQMLIAQEMDARADALQDAIDDSDGGGIVLPPITTPYALPPATEGQTSFALPFDLMGDPDVLLNGVELLAEDFAIMADMIQFTLPLAAGDRVVLKAPQIATDIAFDNSVSYRRGSALAKLRQFANPLDRPWRAAGDGVTLDTAALAAAAAAGPIIITGNHRIDADIVFAHPVAFAGEGRLTWAAPVKPTFLGGIVAAENRQIFSTDGVVGGLSDIQAMWFVGDISTLPGLPLSAIDATSAMTRAFTSVGKGIVRDGPWCRRILGAEFIDVGEASYEGGGVTFKVQGLVRNGLRAAYAPEGGAAYRGGGWLRGFNIELVNPGFAAVDGKALYLARPDTSASEFSIREAHTAVYQKDSTGNPIDNFHIYDALFSGIWVNSLDCTVGSGVIQALYDLVNLSGVSGTFAEGDTLTFTGGTGTVGTVYAAGRMRMFFSILPTAGLVVTSSSGGTGTIASVDIGHQVGGIRTEGFVEALSVGNKGTTEVLGGLYSFVSQGPAAVGRGGLCASELGPGLKCDTSYQGSYIRGAYDCQFDFWRSNTRVKNAPVLDLDYCGGHCHVGGRTWNGRGAGIQARGTCRDLLIDGAALNGNCLDYDIANMAELRIDNGASHITVVHVRAGWLSWSGLTTPPKSIYIAAATDYITLSCLNVPAGSVTNASTGTHNRIIAVPGSADA